MLLKGGCGSVKGAASALWIVEIVTIVEIVAIVFIVAIEKNNQPFNI